MVDTLAEVLAQETIAEPEDLASYGLDDPQCTVTLTADGTDYELLIGDETVLGGQLYLSTGDGSVYLVDTSLLDAFAYGLYDIIQMEEIPAMDDVSALTIDGETGPWRSAARRTAAWPTATTTCGSWRKAGTGWPWIRT